LKTYSTHNLTGHAILHSLFLIDAALPGSGCIARRHAVEALPCWESSTRGRSLSV